MSGDLLTAFDREAIEQGRRLDLSRWSRQLTADGYLVRRGQVLYRRRGQFVDVSRVGRVTADDEIFDQASETGAVRGRRLRLADWVTEYGAVPPRKQPTARRKLAGRKQR